MRKVTIEMKKTVGREKGKKQNSDEKNTISITETTIEPEKRRTTVIPDEMLLRTKDVQKKLGISRTTLHRWQKEGKIPPPIKISQNMVAWPMSQIRQVIVDLSQGHA